MIEHRHSEETRPYGYTVFTGYIESLYDILAKEGFTYMDLQKDPYSEENNTAIILLDCGLKLSLKLIQSSFGHFSEAEVILFKGCYKDFGENVINQKSNVTCYPSKQENIRIEFIARAKDALDKYVNETHFNRVYDTLKEWAKK